MLVINAVSLNMVPRHVASGAIVFRRIDPREARYWAVKAWQAGKLYSAVGHQDTAMAVSVDLGVPVAYNRETIKLGTEWSLVVQYSGPRLPEGTVELPPEARIEYFLVRLETRD